MRWNLKWQPDEGIWHIYFFFILSTTLTQEFLGCIILTLHRIVHVGKGNGLSFILTRDLGCWWLLCGDLSDLTFLRLSTSCAQRWDVGRKKVWWAGSWWPVHLWNQLVTSCLALSSSPLRLSGSSDVSARKNVSFLFLHPQHRRVPGCSRCSANVCPTVGAGGGPRAYPCVCSEECWSLEGGLRRDFSSRPSL